MSDVRQVKVWYNKPQRKAILTSCKEEYGVWGRGTGKTQGPIAHRTILGANAMPRGATGIIGFSYAQLLDRTLPPLMKAWEKMGYYENVHYWVRKRPPEKLGVPAPIYKVLTPEHSIFWWNGHVFHMISQDRPGLANGKTLDALVADEARFMNHARYMDDIAPINRGNKEIFGSFGLHHMITMYTDMPTDPKGKWILDKRDQMDEGIVKNIINLQIHANDLKIKFKESQDPNSKKYYYRKIRECEGVLNELRRDAVFYSEASSLDNIQILGEDQIRQWRREMLYPVFQASILNERVITVENGFYHLLDTDFHCYSGNDYAYIDSLGIYLPEGSLNDCRKDGDIVKGLPIDISLDYNSKIKSLVCGQETKSAYRMLKSMFVKREQQKILDDLIDEFCAYYKYHDTHHVIFYFDHTALVTDATRLDTLADIVTSRLQYNNWTVSRVYIGKQPRHETRYRMWENVLKERDDRFVRVRFNRENCDSLITSMQQTRVRVGKNGFEKDKRDEQNSSVKPEDAPHLGDAADTLYIGKFNTTYGYSNPISELIIA